MNTQSMNRIWFGFFLLLFLSTHSLANEFKNGFSLDHASIPVEQILQGGPPRDGIPAIDQPEFIHAKDATFLHGSDRVLGLHLNGIAKAYPIRILNWHEIVNDQFEQQAVVVSFCPLCGTGMAFDAMMNGKTHSFGVSGLLYESDVLLYDRETESLWSQIKTESVTGPLSGSKLTLLPALHTSWRNWQSKYPDTLVLSLNTGYERDYSRNPYAGYEQARQLYFQVSNAAPQTYHPKERIMGVEVNGQFKAYPFMELNKRNQQKFPDSFNGENYEVVWDASAQSAYIQTPSGNMLPTVTAFWFAWFTFHPETEVFQHSE